jgi:hypothetical protein
MRKLITIIGLEAYALALTGWQLYLGVRTDEAKYLLNIPYPHPPFARSIMSSLDGWEYQEVFWRVIMATLVVQGVWLALDLMRDRSVRERCLVAMAWLLSAAVVFQSGTVMMAPLTALQGLVFLWLVLKKRDQTAQAGLIALFWLISLFTAYQAVLFGPLVLGIFLRMRRPLWQKLLLVGLPVALLALYTLTNPLALASMVNHVEKDAVQTLFERVIDTAWVWAMGGSIVLSIAGTVGIFFSRRWEIVLSFLLVLAYVFLSRYDYYAILFTPLFIVGLIVLISKKPSVLMPVALLVPVGTILLFLMRPPTLVPSVARQVVDAIPFSIKGDFAISGSFGHEWQYEATEWRSVRRYIPGELADMHAVICIQPCEDMKQQTGWNPLTGLPMEVWVKE